MPPAAAAAASGPAPRSDATSDAAAKTVRANVINRAIASFSAAIDLKELP
jgi:hypothetical protein